MKIDSPKGLERVRPFCDRLEYRVLNATHGDVGAYLLGLWGLPGSIVETAAFHHRLDSYPTPTFCTSLIVHIADIIDHMLHPQPTSPSPALNLAFLEQTGKADRFDHWLEQCRQLDMTNLP